MERAPGAGHVRQIVAAADGGLWAVVEAKAKGEGDPQLWHRDRDGAWEEIELPGLMTPEGRTGLDIAMDDDDQLWLIRDHMYDADGMETHDFWEAVSFDSNLLPAPAVFSQAADDLVWTSRTYVLPEMPTSLRSRVRLRAIGLEIIDELIASGDLDPIYRDAFTTFEVENTQIEWPGDEPVEVDGFGTCAYKAVGCLAPEIREVVGGP